MSLFEANASTTTNNFIYQVNMTTDRRWKLCKNCVLQMHTYSFLYIFENNMHAWVGNLKNENHAAVESLKLDNGL